jgi:hypothetical protein
MEAEDHAKARQQQMEAQRQQIEALEGIRDEIHNLPMRQYIWGN